ncbi:MAG TPA: family 1 encapsulin nanocompartment shell protein [Methanomicrobiales archaeon]|nr:family 1 encapsulin nanocompartment shell protein [Methanomicrobiales archaeon]
MHSTYLGRDDAPISGETWNLLDTVMVEAAKGILAGRRLLGISGPYGLGLKTVPMADGRGRKGFITSDTIPVPLLQSSFCLGKRDIAAYERDHVAFDACGVATAACACATAEDALIFQGAPGIAGLVSAKGSQSVKISPWETVGAAADEVIAAVTSLDEAGFHGPYCMGLAPARFNLLFRRYPQGEGTELDHLRSIVTGGIYKAPVLSEGGVLLASGKQYAEIVIGQDMSVGFIGPAEENLEFSISESLVPVIHTPAAVCVLK